jgi:hypothetical protein
MNLRLAVSNTVMNFRVLEKTGNVLSSCIIYLQCWGGVLLRVVRCLISLLFTAPGVSICGAHCECFVLSRDRLGTENDIPLVCVGLGLPRSCTGDVNPNVENRHPLPRGLSSQVM